MQPDVMLREVATLAADLRGYHSSGMSQARAAVESREVPAIYLVGDGDSYHASCAAELAFESIAKVSCRPMSALRFLEYGAEWMRCGPRYRPLVVATSSSGETPRVVDAVERANAFGAQTLCLTGIAGSTVTRVAGHSIVLDLPGKQRSPGIRSYQASLVGLLLLAVELGAARAAHDRGRADALGVAVLDLAGAIERTNHAIAARCHDLAATLLDAPTIAVLGAGPHHGTAMYAAAKIIEASGIPALAPDLEEWWHVERFARPFDMPMVVVAPPGRGHWRAAEVAERGTLLGRRVVAVVSADDDAVSQHAGTVLPVVDDVREEFAPLLYHLFASHLAAHLAAGLGRAPFQSAAHDQR
jgi:glutamine---fructose-6-phosphate transaminase (isomerizing)